MNNLTNENTKYEFAVEVLGYEPDSEKIQSLIYDALDKAQSDDAGLCERFHHARVKLSEDEELTDEEQQVLDQIDSIADGVVEECLKDWQSAPKNASVVVGSWCC